MNKNIAPYIDHGGWELAAMGQPTHSLHSCSVMCVRTSVELLSVHACTDRWVGLCPIIEGMFVYTFVCVCEEQDIRELQHRTQSKHLEKLSWGLAYHLTGTHSHTNMYTFLKCMCWYCISIINGYCLHFLFLQLYRCAVSPPLSIALRKAVSIYYALSIL